MRNKMKSVMRIVEKMAREKDVWVEELSNESEERDNLCHCLPEDV